MNSDRLCGKRTVLCLTSYSIGEKIPKPTENPRNRNKNIMDVEAISCKMVEDKHELYANVFNRSELVKDNSDCVNNFYCC